MSSNTVALDAMETPEFADSVSDGAVTPGAKKSAPDVGFHFEAMNLKPGDRMQIQVPSKLSDERCFVSLIGFLPGHSILITTPTTASNVRLQLIEDDQVVMRIFSRQQAFAFSSDVLRTCKLPYSYLHISVPRAIEGTVIRKAARVKTKIIVKVNADEGRAAEQTGVISNLSANGALLDGRKNIAEVGDTIQTTFNLKLHNVETRLSLRAIVRAAFDDDTLRQSGTSLTHFGLEFLDLQPNDHMILQSMVYQKMIEEPLSLV